MGSEDFLALNDVSINIEKGEMVSVLGPSGSGKSTMMHIIGLLDSPTSGQYFLNDKDVSKLSLSEKAIIRSQTIGFVFQSVGNC